jgi:hypothetical protein
MPKHDVEKAARDLQRTLPGAMSLVEQSRRSARESSADRRKAGKAMRQGVPISSHAEVRAATDRSDPIALLLSQDAVRIASLVPIRFGRMVASPSPSTAWQRCDGGRPAGTHDRRWPGCGDHLNNFGAFGTE